MIGRTFALWIAAAGLTVLQPLAPASAATDVRPSDRVRAAVVVRAAPTANSEDLARLRPGETLDFSGDVSGWYRVTLPDGRTGYVSKAWTDLVDDAEPLAPEYRVHLVDVGTGLATFVEGPGFTLVYDGGSNDDKARGANNRFLAYLRKVRPDLAVIDHMILSHPHRDHVELLPDLFDAYEVRNVWDSGRPYDNCGYRAFLEKVRDEPGLVYHDAHTGLGSHVALLSTRSCYSGPVTAFNVAFPHGSPVTAGLVVPLGGHARMTFLHADAHEHADANQNSVPIRLDLGSARLLFMGDAEAGERPKPHQGLPDPDPGSTEGLLIANFASEIEADVLVAGHHGSLTSSRPKFLDAVKARIYVVSSGPLGYGKNKVRLPDQPIIDLFKARGELWRTDEQDVACKTDTAKIGPEKPAKAGGCDNILIRVSGAGEIAVNYERIFD